MHPERDTRIPVTIITGFLGSGKTTLLNHWVKQPELSDCAVLINEFGSVGLDHQLVKQVDEQVMLLDSGCICCSVQGSLATA
ncbi:MAG: GTP-binding protein, partial [Aeromonadaceae bacterium]|nr:GTP-binding protein [Aeromonadaceae bacterium]